jgi:hypothetical protein
MKFTVALITLLAAISSYGAASPVALTALNNMLDRTPIKNETVTVGSGWNTNDWGGDRSFTHYPNSVAVTNPAIGDGFGGHIFLAKDGGRWISRDINALDQDVRWFYVTTNLTIDATSGLNAAHAFCTNNLFFNNVYASMPGMQLPRGTMLIKSPVNFSMPWDVTNSFPRNDNVAWRLTGQGPYNTQFKVSFTNTLDTNYPALDFCSLDSSRVGGFSVIVDDNNPIRPKCAMLLARIGRSHSAGLNQFSDIHVAGNVGLAQFIIVAAEVNIFTNLRFQQYNENNQYSVLQIGYYLNGRIASKFNDMNNDVSGQGNGVNTWNTCYFHSYANSGNGTNVYPRFRGEFIQHMNMFGPYFVTPTNASAAMELDLRCEGITIIGVQQENAFGTVATPFLSVVSQSILGSTNLGQGPVKGITIIDSSIGGVYGTNLSQIFDLTMFGNRYYGESTTNLSVNLTNVFPLLNVYDLTGSHISASRTATNYSEPYLVSLNVRGTSSDNLWYIPTNATLTINSGGENDFFVQRNLDIAPRFLAQEFGGLDFSRVTNDNTHVSGLLVPASYPGTKSFTVQATVTFPPRQASDGATHGIVSFAGQTNGAFVTEGGFGLSQNQSDLRLIAYGATVNDTSEYRYDGVVNAFIGKRAKLTFVRDEGTNAVRLYINGYLQSNSTNIVTGGGANWGQNMSRATNVNIGGIQATAVTNTFKGIMHDVVYWTNSFTGSEVQSIAMYSWTPNITAPRLYYDFSAYSGRSSVQDFTGNGQTASIHGDPRSAAHYSAGGTFVERAGDTMTGQLVIDVNGGVDNFTLYRSDFGLGTRFGLPGGGLTITTPSGALKLENTNNIGTNVSTKVNGVDISQYTNTTSRPFRGFQMQTTAGQNVLDLGGGGAFQDAATDVKFWAGGTVGTQTGTLIAYIKTNGLSLSAATNTLQYVFGTITDPTTGTPALVYAQSASVFGGGGITDAPSDGQLYGRSNALWAIVGSGGGGGGIPEAPSTGVPYGRQDAAWTNLNEIYGRLATSNTWAGTNTFAGVTVNGPFLAPGSGANSFRIGSTLATAIGDNSIAIGNADSTGNNSVSIGEGSATEINSVAIGAAAVATGSGSVAIGPSANDSGWNNSVALGSGAQPLTNFQVRLGGVGHSVSVPGNLTVRSRTNATANYIPVFDALPSTTPRELLTMSDQNFANYISTFLSISTNTATGTGVTNLGGTFYGSYYGGSGIRMITNVSGIEVNTVVTNTGVGVTNIGGTVSANIIAGTNMVIATNTYGQISIGWATNYVFTTTTNTIISVSPTLTTNVVAIEFPYATAVFIASNSVPSGYELQGLDTTFSSNVASVVRVIGQSYQIILNSNQPTNELKAVRLFHMHDVGDTILAPWHLSHTVDSGGTNYTAVLKTNLIFAGTGIGSYDTGLKVGFRLYSIEYVTNLVISSTTLVTNTIISTYASVPVPPEPPSTNSNFVLFVNGTPVTNANIGDTFHAGYATSLTTNVLLNPQEVQTMSATTMAPDLSQSYNFSLTLTNSATLTTPINITTPMIGQAFTFALNQDGTGNRILTLSTNWMFGDGVTIDGGYTLGITTNANATTYLRGIVRSSTLLEAIGYASGYLP